MSQFPEFIKNLPNIDIALEGVIGKLLQAKDHQVVFFEIEPIGSIPPHTHQDQWGVVLEGEMDLTIGGETKSYTRGDSYFIPAGVEHSATFKTRVKVIDVFAEPNRYQAE
jgi:quercetin dioxygenase-like cupin family protein